LKRFILGFFLWSGPFFPSVDFCGERGFFEQPSQDFPKERAIDGVVVTLPSFGDGRVIADTLKLARPWSSGPYSSYARYSVEINLLLRSHT
jgi:hypothetical protein